MNSLFRLRRWVLVGNGLVLAGPALAQLGPTSESFFFRAYSPQGQLITPAVKEYRIYLQDPEYHTGLLEITQVITRPHNPPAPNFPYQGRQMTTSWASLETYRPGADWAKLSTYYFDGFAKWYAVLPPKGLSGSEVSSRFRLVIAHGRDTMQVFAPFGSRDFVLDSIPYRPGAYHLTGIIRLGERLLREVEPAARLQPGVRADWRYLQQPVPEVVAELIEQFPNDDQARERRAARRTAREQRLYANAYANYLALQATPTKHVGLASSYAFPIAGLEAEVSYFAWQSNLLLRQVAAATYQLYTLTDAWPANVTKVSRSSWSNLALDSVYTAGGNWYGIGASNYFTYVGPNNTSEETRPFYGRFRLYFPTDLTPAARQQLEQAAVRQQCAANPGLAAALRQGASPPPTGN